MAENAEATRTEALLRYQIDFQFSVGVRIGQVLDIKM